MCGSRSVLCDDTIPAVFGVALLRVRCVFHGCLIPMIFRSTEQSNSVGVAWCARTRARIHHTWALFGWGRVGGFGNAGGNISGNRKYAVLLKVFARIRARSPRTYLAALRSRYSSTIRLMISERLTPSRFASSRRNSICGFVNTMDRWMVFIRTRLAIVQPVVKGAR